MTRKNHSLSFILLLLLPVAAYAVEFHVSHDDPIAPVILGVTGILFVALIGRFSARKLGFPSVIGELIMGIAVGNLAFFYQVDLVTVLREGPAIFDTIENLLKGEELELACLNAVGAEGTWHILDILRGEHGGEILQVAHAVDVFSRYGIIFLLFLLGLDMQPQSLLRVFKQVTLVTLISSLIFAASGYAIARLFAFDVLESLIIGAAMMFSSTIIGIKLLPTTILHHRHTGELGTGR